MDVVVVKSSGDADSDLRSAICIYLISERREGATIGELARLELGGHPATQEVARVSDAVSELVREGEVVVEEKLVRLLIDPPPGASDD